MKLTSSEPDIHTIVHRIDKGDIDLQPDFQRQEVWPLAKKRKLIDTIVRGWSIPPLHLVETSDHKLEVLDGQQRLAAIRDFLHDKFSIDGRITPVDEGVQLLHGLFYSQLDAGIRRRIDQYPLRCFRIVDYLPEEPSELFYRLNQPTVLTAGEQRNALFGPARHQMKQLVDLFERLGNTKSTLGFSNARLAYDDIIARLLVFLETRDFGTKSTENKVSERFRSQTQFDPRAVSRAELAIGYFSTDREDAPPYRFNKANVLSWLLFYSRFTDDRPAPGFMGMFISIGARESLNHLLPAVSVFNDRSSLRVTDVTSVIFRDFVLLYAYRVLRMGPMPGSINPAAWFDHFEAPTQTAFERLLMERVDPRRWSETL